MQLTGGYRTDSWPAAGCRTSCVSGDPDEPLGRIEIIEYQQLQGEHISARETAATGILHMNYR
jgi:hypothetical protein